MLLTPASAFVPNPVNSKIALVTSEQSLRCQNNYTSQYPTILNKSSFLVVLQQYVFTVCMELDMDLRSQYIAEGSRDQHFNHLGQFFNNVVKKGSPECLPTFLYQFALVHRDFYSKNVISEVFSSLVLSHMVLQCTISFFLFL